MSDNDSNNEPQLNKKLKVFIIVGTVFIVCFGIFYFTTHSGSSEFTRTQIEPDSNLADKELIVKQDTLRRDTAAADSANKEEEEQAEKLFNSIRGNNRHKSDSTETAQEPESGETEKPVEQSGTEKDKEQQPAATENTPKVESLE